MASDHVRQDEPGAAKAPKDRTPAYGGKSRTHLMTMARRPHEIGMAMDSSLGTRYATETAWSRQMDRVSLDALLRATEPPQSRPASSDASDEKNASQPICTASPRAVQDGDVPGPKVTPRWIKESSLGSDWSSVVGGEDTSSGQTSTRLRSEHPPSRQPMALHSHLEQSDVSKDSSSTGSIRPLQRASLRGSNDNGRESIKHGTSGLPDAEVGRQSAKTDPETKLQSPTTEPTQAASPTRSTFSQDERNMLSFLESLSISRISGSLLGSSQRHEGQIYARISSDLARSNPSHSVAETPTQELLIAETAKLGINGDISSGSTAATAAVDRFTASPMGDAGQEEQPSGLGGLSEISKSDYDILNSSTVESVVDEHGLPSAPEEVVDEEWEWTDAVESLSED